MTPAEIAECLEKGGVVLIPTDTVLGLAARPDRPDAVARLFALKDRPLEKNLPVMVGELSQIAGLGAQVTPSADILMTSGHMPGPLTLVLGLGAARPFWLSGRDEVAVRIPDAELLRSVLRLSGPLLVTSANRSGLPTPQTSAQAAAQLTAQPDLVVAGENAGGTPSTLVNCRLTPPRIEREGAVEAAEIYEILEGKA